MIGGNTSITLKRKNTEAFNSIGERVPEWENYLTIPGFLDFMNESTGRTNYNAKIVESTHVFICDYVEIDVSEKDLQAEINNKPYEVKYIDDPMSLHKHLEIFLNYIGD